MPINLFYLLFKQQVMSKINDTGHAKNVANFGALIANVVSYGPVYNPNNVNIRLNSLTEKAAAAQAIIQQVNDLAGQNSNAIALRDLAFEPLKKLGTRILNSVRASNVPRQVLDNAITHNRKMQGQRASAKLSDEEKQKLAADGIVVNQVSASQLSYDNQLNTLDKQIKLLATIPAYAPNETELQLTSLTALYNDLLQKNRDVITKTTDLNVFRINRDKVIYDAETGVVALAQDVKNYVKSIFGAGTPEHRLISGIPFKTIKM